MTFSKEEQFFVESALPFFKQLTKINQRNMESQMYLKSFQKGVSMHSGSGDCSGLFLVKSGHIRVYIISENGKEITLYRLFERDVCIFSASCMMKNINFDVFVEAEVDTTVFIIPADYYFALSQNVIELSDYTMKLMSSRFTDVMWVMEQVLFTSFDKRLAEFLLMQSVIEDSDELHITHETIAKNLGSAREVVTRMLKYFSDEGMVSLSRGGITILNKKNLQNLA